MNFNSKLKKKVTSLLIAIELDSNLNMQRSSKKIKLILNNLNFDLNDKLIVCNSISF